MFCNETGFLLKNGVILIKAIKQCSVPNQDYKASPKKMIFVKKDNGILKWYCVKICVYDEHPIAGQGTQYPAPYSRSRYTPPFDDYKVMCTHANNPGSQ